MRIKAADDKQRLARAKVSGVNRFARSTLTFVLSWLAVAAALFGGVYVLALSATGQAPAICHPAPGAFGLRFTLASQLAITLAGATLVVGGLWALSARPRLVQAGGIVAVIVVAVFSLGLAGAVVPFCTGGAFR
jgi:hypothetical protein